MFDWLKRKKNVHPPAPTTPKPQNREELVASAMKNAEMARAAIGAENLAKLSALIQQKQMEQEVSPAAQAKKIIAHLDKDKMGDFLKAMVSDSQTRH